MEKDRELFAKALQEAFIRKFEADLAEPVINIPTGTMLKPGAPEHYPGRGYYHPDFECRREGSNHYLLSFPEAMPKKEE